MADYDVIVIGSGAGGLTAAVSLAKSGKKVLVLEQHYLPGGWCHSFSLEGYKFSPGVHYIGQLQEGGRMRQVYEGLGVADDMTFLELNPDGFDHVRIGQERFDICKGKEPLTERLCERFPTQAAPIRKYMDIIAGINDEIANKPQPQIGGLRDVLGLPSRYENLIRWGLRSVDSTMDACGIVNPLLRNILTIQAGDHGLPSSRCPTAVHATVVGHYFQGGWYPKGGGMAIPRAFIKALRRHGGELKMRSEVEQILVKNREVHGVRLADGTEISAPVVVSNADPGVTWEELVPRSEVPRRVKFRLRRTKYSLSGLSLFFAVDMDLEAAGLDSGNVWYATGNNVEAMYDLAATPKLREYGEIPGAFLTCTTLKDRTARRDDIHTLESFSFVNNKAFSRWAGTEMGERGADYEAFKEELTDRMFRRIDEIVPGIRDATVFHELGTPLTNRYYCQSTEGNLYGIEKNLFQMGPLGFPIVTPVNGLYMAGASTIGHGVAGATYSGLQAARAILGCRNRDILTEKQSLRLLPAEDVSSWPDELKGKKSRLPKLANPTGEAAVAK